MFTGIVEELGTVRTVTRRSDGARLEFACDRVREGAGIGDSIAVDGCCLTVVELGDGWWGTDAQPESIARTTLGRRAVGAPVNLERPVRVSDRLGGHLVQGHVDGVASVLARTPELDSSVRFELGLDSALGRYVVEKGSITLDGVSLTVTHVHDSGPGEPVRLGIAVIPHTLAATTFGTRQVGDAVNVEVDVLAKYVERLLAPRGE